MWLQMLKFDCFIPMTVNTIRNKFWAIYLTYFIQSAKLKKKLKRCQDAEARRNVLFTALYLHTPKDTDKTETPLTWESRYHNRDSKWVLSILKCTSLQLLQLARSVYRLEGMLNVNPSNLLCRFPPCNACSFKRNSWTRTSIYTVL
jgi:hypothetical protein